MEAALGVIEERLRTFDARIRSNHDSIAKLREQQGTQDKALVRIEGKQAELTNDIAEMKDDLKVIKRGIFVAIAVGLTFTVAVASLVIQAAAG